MMIKLTKEECLKALKGLIYKSEVNETEWLEDKQCWLVKDAYQRKIGLLFQLINEHFDNPPLKFEELEENNWYWDNKDKEWCKYISYSTFEYLDGYGSEFEENRFYRKEAKDD